MPRTNRNPSSGESEREKWLERGPRLRDRPWVLEEELFGSSSRIARQRELEALLADLVEEESKLTGMADELHRHAARIAGLKRQLEALIVSPTSLQPWSDSAGRVAGGGPTSGTSEPDYMLCRCEGFEVDSPTRRVGVVEGVRYHSRIDRPDVLEVRTGPFGRHLLLIPVDEVEQVLFEEGLVVLRSAPDLRHESFHELLARLRGRMHNGSPRPHQQL